MFRTRTTNEVLKALLEQVNKELVKNNQPVLTLDFANGGVKLENHDGSANITDRMTKKEMEIYLRGAANGASLFKR